MNIRTLLAAGLVTAVGVVAAPESPDRITGPVRVLERAVPAAAPQDFPWHDYDGSFTFVRVRYQDYGRSGFRRRGFGNGPGWYHDYPDSERNFSKIAQELTLARVRQSDWGGNVITLDDPRLMLFPVAYMSEPGQWAVTEDEAEGLRNYLLKGGFIFFDDFAGNDMYNLAVQMQRVLPELQFQLVDGTESIFDSFFKIEPFTIVLASYRGYRPEWYVMYEDNDPEKRILAVAGNNSDLGEYWEFSGTGFYPVDLSNEAYKVGVNYLIYALTH